MRTPAGKIGRARRQAGQAMIETVVACGLVLVPLFLAIPVIAKYQDIRASVAQGARYAAWERTVWFGGASAKSAGSNKWNSNAKSDEAIRAEVGTRILSRTSVAFDSDADKAESGYVDGAKQLWVDRRGTSLLNDYSDISNTVTNDGSPGIANKVVGPLVSAASFMSDFTVDTNSRFTAKIGLSVKEVAFNTETSGLGPCGSCPVDYLATSNTMNFSDKNVIVANGWSANGPGSLKELSATATKDRTSTYKQVRGLTPTSIFKPLSGGVYDTIMKILNVIAKIILPELSTLDLGRVEVDRVPADRTP